MGVTGLWQITVPYNSEAPSITLTPPQPLGQETTNREGVLLCRSFGCGGVSVVDGASEL